MIPIILQKVKSSSFFIIGFLLSPLCWWNDLFFNLPVAYGFGKIMAFFSADWLIPACIVGYWLSNVVGILMMQFGAISFFDQPAEKQNLRKNLIVGMTSSTVFTLVAVILWQNHFLDFAIPSFPAGI